MFCTKCGKPIADNLNFCPFCGERQAENVTQVLREEAQAPTYQAPAPETYAPVAPAPEAYAPVAPAPEAYAPEAPAPEAYAPAAPAPEAPAPEAPASEAPAPEAPAPEAYAPQAAPYAQATNAENNGWAPPVQNNPTGNYYGAPPTQNNGWVPPVQNNSTEAFYGVPPKKKKSAKGPILIILAVVLAALAVVVYLFFPFFKNQFRSIFYSGEKYMSAVIKDDLENVADLTDYYYNVVPTSMSAQGSGTLKATISEDATALIKEYTGTNLSKLQEVTMDTKYATKDGKYYVSADVKVNSDDVATAAFVMNENGMYLQTDLLGSSYYEIPLDSDYQQSMEQGQQILNAYPDQETCRKLIDKYGALLADNLSSVTKSKDDVKFGDLKVSTTKLSAKITSGVVYNLAKAALKEAENDKEIKAIVADFAEVLGEDADDIIEQYEDRLEDALDNLEKDDFEFIDDLDIKFIINVDANGEVVCRTVEYQDMTFSLYSIEKGKKFASGIEADVGEEMALLLEGTKSGSKYSGTITVTYGAVDVKIGSFDGIDTETCKQGKIAGTITLNTKDIPMDMLSQVMDEDIVELLSDTELVIDFNTDYTNLSADNTITLKHQGKEFVKLSIVGKKDSVDIPAVSNATDIDDIDYYTSLAAYYKLNDLLEDLAG